MRPSLIATRLTAALAASLLTTLTGCPAPGNKTDGDAKLRRFQSADELVRYVRAQVRASQRSNFFGLPRSFNAAEDLGGAPVPSAGGDDAFDGDSAGGAVDFTGTNIQEAGVDESDYFKFDGEYLYIGRGETVRIVRAFPTDAMEEIAQVDLGERVSDLYLHDGRLIVLTTPGYEVGPALVDTLIWPPYYFDAAFTVTAIDISDPASPQVQESAEFEGSAVSSRLTGGKLIIVMTIEPEVPTDLLGIETIGLDDILPMRTTAGGAEPAMQWDSFFRPDEENGYRMTAVLTLDAADVTQTLASSAIVAGAGTIYSSPDALYVTDTEYDVDDDLREETDIHKFAFDDNGVAAYTGSGSVPGRPLNQFSLGEHEGYLRIATHVENFSFGGGDDVAVGIGGGDVVDVASPPDDAGDSSPGSTEPSSGTAQAAEVDGPYNAVYVLGESEGELAIAGQIINIAPGETLYSARFIGERGFLVTFERIDPLFTVDLSQPTKPELRGELKVPGFSDYLHPFGENYLIGVGRSTEEAPWGGIVAEGVQLSLFDVSDLDNPTAIQQIKVGGSGSMADASYDHKAFAFLASQGVLALPATIYPDDFSWNDWNGVESPEVFSGVTAWHVDPADGFEEIGRLSTLNPDEFGYFYGGWRRAIVADGVLYALTENGVRAAPMDQLDAAMELPLED